MYPKLVKSLDTVEIAFTATKSCTIKEEKWPWLTLAVNAQTCKNRIEPAIEERVVSFAFEYPAYGQQRASNELKKEGVFISPCGVRCVWLRHDLETFKKRLKALEAKAAQEI
jgi:hypothetical protein